MKRFISKYLKPITIGIIASVGILLMITAVAMLVQYSNEVAERSTSQAKYNTSSTKQDLIDVMNGLTAKAISASAGMRDLNSQNAVNDYLNALKEKEEFSDILMVRYFKGNTLYDSYGSPLTDTDTDLAYSFRAESPNDFGFIGSFQDRTTLDQGELRIIGFYSPVTDSAIADALVIYYTWDKISVSFPEDIRHEDAVFTVLATQTGEIVLGRTDVENAQIFDALRLKVGEKDAVEKVKRLMVNGTDGTVQVNIEGVDYLVSVGADASRLKDLSIVELYPVSVLCQSSFTFIGTIIAVFVMFAIILIAVIIYLLAHHYSMKRQIFDMETNDRQLECFNRYGFENEVTRVLEINQTSYFAVIVVHIRHFKFLTETYGASEINRLLSYLRLICSKTCMIEETYGYMGSGQFLFLLHAKNREALLERLKVHSFLAAKYQGSDKTLNVMLKYGIYEVDHQEKVSSSQMIDFANEANNTVVKATAENAGMQFNFYNMELRKIRLINEDMELRMEPALENGEFQVFYQPKYNLRLGKQDGCEALVRWYDQKTGEYNRPALFMPLFESNGFIVKLDKYIYTKVCEYISYSIAQGRPVYPVSVNVSRITAVQPDFIDFYSKTKRRYGLVDGQIMIEFTESFAYENDETLREIVDELHKNGFKCSIDDFGCGYSSYSILKKLRMDEIKLDRFFIEPGESMERDETILRSIIDLAKKLGMKVTQEGVELREDVDRLIDLGCDVLQGYYYARPLSLSDYINFVSSSKEHNITTKK